MTDASKTVKVIHLPVRATTMTLKEQGEVKEEEEQEEQEEKWSKR